jgi:hypothetical protein
MAGVAGMASPVKAVPTSEPGVNTSMTGLSTEVRWLFSVAAKVPGEHRGRQGHLQGYQVGTLVYE